MIPTVARRCPRRASVHVTARSPGDAQAWHWVDPVRGAHQAAAARTIVGRWVAMWSREDDPALTEVLTDVDSRVAPHLVAERRDARDRESELVGLVTAGLTASTAFEHVERHEVSWTSQPVGADRPVRRDRTSTRPVDLPALADTPRCADRRPGGRVPLGAPEPSTSPGEVLGSCSSTSGPGASAGPVSPSSRRCCRTQRCAGVGRAEHRRITAAASVVADHREQTTCTQVAPLPVSSEEGQPAASHDGGPQRRSCAVVAT